MPKPRAAGICKEKRPVIKSDDRSFYGSISSCARWKRYFQRAQEVFLTDGVDLEEDRLTAAGSYGREHDEASDGLEQRDIQADAVAAEGAVALKYPDAAPRAVFGEVA